MFASTLRALGAVAGIALFAVAACTPIYENHGYAPDEEQLAELIVGVDTRATVDDVIGTPSAAGVLGEGDYYYVRKQIKTVGMFRPEVVERQVVAISFKNDGTIANIERFGLEDGYVVALSRRVTDSSVVGNGFLRQILGNFGQFDPEQMFN